MIPKKEKQTKENLFFLLNNETETNKNKNKTKNCKEKNKTKVYLN
jgi:hypothetical protein